MTDDQMHKQDDPLHEIAAFAYGGCLSSVLCMLVLGLAWAAYAVYVALR